MKYWTIVILAIIAVASCVSKSTNLSLGTQINQQDSKTFVKFAKMITCATKPLEKSCKQCIQPANGYKLFFFYQTTRLQKHHFKFMIHYNDQQKKVLISLAGPSVSTHPKYVQLIYSNGFTWIRRFKIQVESEYKRVYFAQLRKVLLAKVHKIKKSGRANYKFIFVGHSTGGSMATLASYDLTNAKVISKKHNGTTVYTYGGLRIGDARFITLVNSSVYFYRIIRNDDYVVRIPTCYYSPTGSWSCFTRSVINRYITVPSSPLFFYLQNYRYSTYYHVPAYTAVKTYTTFWRKNHGAEASHHRVQHNHHSSPHHNLTRRAPQEFGTKRKPIQESHLARRHALQNQMQRNRNVMHRPMSRFNKLNKFDLKKKFNKRELYPNKRPQLLAPKPTFNSSTFKPRVNPAEKLFAPVNREHKAHHTHHSHNSKPAHHNKHQDSRWRSPEIKKPKLVNLPKLQIAPKAAEKYYFTNVYYTQPFGSLFYVNPYGVFTPCVYVNFVSACETRITLPATFTVASHLTYLGESFDVCPI